MAHWLDRPAVQAAITRRMLADGADEAERWQYEQEEYEINSPACRRIDFWGDVVTLGAMILMAGYCTIDWLTR